MSQNVVGNEEEKKEEKKEDPGEEEKKEEVKEEELISEGINEMEIIRDEIKKKQPLVSDPKPLSELLNEFKDHSNYQRQIQWLISDKKHATYRQLRADGNCFYRAFLLGLFETIETTKSEKLLQAVTKSVLSSCDRLLQFGYEQFAIGEFYEAFMDELGFYQSKLTDPDIEVTGGIGVTAVQRLGHDTH
ncbi:hypothetical protein RFI_13297, partial [Reticulomyxa filosa]